MLYATFNNFYLILLVFYNKVQRRRLEYLDKTTKYDKISCNISKGKCLPLAHSEISNLYKHSHCNFTNSLHTIQYIPAPGGFIKDGGNVTGFLGFVFSSSNSASLLKMQNDQFYNLQSIYQTVYLVFYI